MNTLQPADDPTQLNPEDFTPPEAITLILQGKPLEAAETIIKYHQNRLPDRHPSKEPQLTGTIEGERVEQFAQFEALKNGVTEVSAFISAMTNARKNPDLLILNLYGYFMDQRRHDMASFTKCLVNNEGSKAVAKQIELRSK